jgi:type II secretory pathway component GspD/PulD (secretin)
MKENCDANQKRSLVSVWMMPGVLMVLGFCAISAGAQAPAADTKPVEPKANPEIYQTLYLTNASDLQNINDVVTAMRNVIPSAKMFANQSQNAISVRATQEDLELAQKILADLDQPRKVYRLTYKITETDGGLPKGTHQISVIAAAGQRTTLKQGSRVPIVTGRIGAEATTQHTEVQYLDVGMNVEATLNGNSGPLNLHTKIEASSIADQASNTGARDPDIRQTMLDCTSAVAPGKSLVLGSIDIPGTTRHEEIEVVAELVR